MRASGIARDRARRFRVDHETGELRESDHGQLVADWVALFAPVLFESRRPTFWPPQGSLLLDHLPSGFRGERLRDSGQLSPFVDHLLQRIEARLAELEPLVEELIRCEEQLAAYEGDS